MLSDRVIQSSPAPRVAKRDACTPSPMPPSDPCSVVKARRSVLATLSKTMQPSTAQRRLNVEKSTPDDRAPSCPRRKRHLMRRRSSSAFEVQQPALGFDDSSRFSSSSTGSTSGRSRASTNASSVATNSSFRSRSNSIEDTKTLVVRRAMRTASFVAQPGALGAFSFDSHFTWMGKLGSGSFADVYAVQHKARPEEKYAIKVLRREFRSRAERAAFLREATLAASLEPHPHVLQYYRAWQDGRIMYVQMELCARGTLRALLRSEPMCSAAAEPAVWRVAREVASALQHIHANGIVHLDVKPDNILVAQSGGYKLGDLGQAVAVGSWDEQDGDARYLSLDLLRGSPSPAADVFSLGISLFEIRAAATLPGHGDAWDALRSAEAPPLPADVDDRLAALITRMMAADTDDRPSAEAVVAACPRPEAPPSSYEPYEPDEAAGRAEAPGGYDAGLDVAEGAAEPYEPFGSCAEPHFTPPRLPERPKSPRASPAKRLAQMLRAAVRGWKALRCGNRVRARQWQSVRSIGEDALSMNV